MSIARFIDKVYPLEELFGEVELAVSQLVDENFSEELEDRQAALMRLLFIMRDTDDEQREYILKKAISYGFQHLPQHKRAVKGYLQELTGAGKKKRRRKPPQAAEVVKN